MNKFVKYGSLAALGVALFISGANAAEVMHNQENAKSPIASSTMVPPGYNIFFISGSTGKGADTAEQTTAALAGLKAQMAKLGLTFGDIVQAHVFLVADPNKGGKMDFAGMNASWSKEFGTAEQPNKPARATIQVAGLAGGDALVEIEFTAVKKAN